MHTTSYQERRGAMDRRQELTSICIRAALGGEAAVREVKMFGALCFMVAEKLAIGVMSDGALLVRADPERADQLLAIDGASQAKMGTGRPMGRSWIRVAASAVQMQESLGFWVDVALEYNKALAVRA